MDGDGADVPDGVGVQDPEEGREVKQLQQGQPLQQHHHHHTPAGVREAPVVPQAPDQPPSQVHQAWGWGGRNRRGLLTGSPPGL